RARPASVLRSSVTLRLPRLNTAYSVLSTSRSGSPPGGSTHHTSAPESASIPLARGPASPREQSTTVIPSSGPATLTFPSLSKPQPPQARVRANLGARRSPEQVAGANGAFTRGRCLRIG